MTIGDMLRTALENMGRRKVRTALTSVGVVVGVLTIVTMVSLGVGVQREIAAQFSALGLENVFVEPGRGEDPDDFFTQFGQGARANPITPELVAEWAARPEVAAVVPQISLGELVTLLELPGGAAAPVRVSGGELLPDPFETAPQAVAGVIGGWGRARWC